MPKQFFLEVKGMVSALSPVYLLVASQSLTPLSCAYNFFTLISVLRYMFLSSLSIGSGGTKLSLKFSVNMLLICTLYYDSCPGYLISSIRTICKYQKCSFLTGLITSLTDLLQAYHQGQIDTSKTKSTGSPVLRSLNFFSVLTGSLFVG